MSYNPKKIQIIINGRYITGFADDDVYNYEETDDRFTPYEGADGEIEYSERASNGAIITINLKHTSPSIRYIEGLYADREDIDVTIKDFNDDGGEEISGTDGVIMRRPDSSRGPEISSKEIQIHVPKHKVRAL